MHELVSTFALDNQCGTVCFYLKKKLENTFCASIEFWENAEWRLEHTSVKVFLVSAAILNSPKPSHYI